MFHMKKILDYFYIFSKLSTSLVLVTLIIIIISYVFYNSYKGVDKDNNTKSGINDI